MSPAPLQTACSSNASAAYSVLLFENFDGKDVSVAEFGSHGFVEDIKNSSFRNSKIHYVYLEDLVFIDCDFSNADIIFEFDQGVVFENCNFRSANFRIYEEDFGNLTSKILNWKDYLNSNPWSSPKFINCTMPDGTRRND